MSGMNGSGDVFSASVALARELARKHEDDKEFQDVLNEMSTYLSDMHTTLEALKGYFERSGGGGEDKAERGEMKALAESMRSVAESIKAMKTAAVPAPVVNLERVGKGWKVDVDLAPNGAIRGLTLKPL